MKLSISTQLFLKSEISEEVFRIISNFGFSSCELWAMGKHFNYKSPEFIKKVKDWSEKYSVKIQTAHLPLYAEDSAGNTFKISLSDKDSAQKSMEEILRCTDALSYLGVETFVMHVGGEVETFLKNFEYIYSKTDCVFALENDPMGFPLAKDLAVLIPEIRRGLKDGERRVGICLDVGHANIWEKPPEKIVELLSSDIFATHISDNDGISDLHHPPYTGTINWKNLLSAFKSVGYSRNFTFEIGPIADTHEQIISVFENIRDFVQDFKEYFDN
jgi:sugar phosphate isomerase/epimerase